MNTHPTHRSRGLAAGLLSVALLASGCTSAGPAGTASSVPDAPANTSPSAPASDHGGMHHPADGGPMPAGMTPASAPRYAVGSQAVLTTDHMEGMQGATATIVAAFDTYTYAVNYTPTTGGEPILDHRWVVQQELRDAGEARLPDDAPVTITAAHMDGMEGARGTVAHSTDETVYAVDYTASGMTMTNHTWVVESEMQPAR